VRDRGLSLEYENIVLKQIVARVREELTGERWAARKVWDSLQGIIEGVKAETAAL